MANLLNRYKDIRFKTPVLRSNVFDYIVAYTVVEGIIDLLVSAANKNDKAEKDVVFRNNAPFRSCI